ncbi:MAG: DUF3168 domain-containing protein [Alphaproteobacteria bacterium]|nr:DUF3168 domain-containing protein [Alphaproteobacteria bacterium]
MSADSCWDVQTGVFTCLTGNTALIAFLADGADSVLDYVPTGTAFPYIVIGESQSKPLDGQRVSGNDMTLTIHTYGRGSGMQEIRRIMSAIYDALHTVSFTVPNQILVLCQCVDSETRLEDDGVTRHGVQRFQIITEPA